jgi:hypothetical protein
MGDALYGLTMRVLIVLAVLLLVWMVYWDVRLGYGAYLRGHPRDANTCYSTVYGEKIC